MSALFSPGRIGGLELDNRIVVSPMCQYGALIFFVLQEVFGDFGVWYLFGTGLVAVVFALALPGGLWGAIHGRLGLRLFPLGERLIKRHSATAPRDDRCLESA